MTDITLEQRARELLAAEYERDGSTFVADCIRHDAEVVTVERRALRAIAAALRLAVPEDTERLDYIERTFSGMTNRERYLPVAMIWGAGANGRTLREACDKYMRLDAAAPTVSAEGEG